jgi:TolB-like protein
MSRPTPKRNCLILLWLSVAVMAAGCSSHYFTRTAETASIVSHPKIAIVPFDNFAGKDLVAAKVTDYFQSIMTNHPRFTLLETGTTSDALRRHRIRSALLLDSAQIESLVQDLKVDYVLTGSVLEYTEIDNTYLGKIPQVSFNARLIDCKTRQTVWTGVSNDAGDRKELLFGVGATRSADELARHMVETLVANLAGLFRQ